MLPINLVRRHNLRRLMEDRGGPTALSKSLGHANGSFLSQVAGPNPRREISEKMARDMEAKLLLRPGFFDEPQGTEKANLHPLSESLTLLVAALGEALLEEIPAEKFSSLCALLLDEYRQRGKVESVFVTRLTKLVARSDA